MSRTTYRRYFRDFYYSEAMIRWLLRDDFNHTVAAGSVDGTSATPGAGTRSVADVENKLSIAGGDLVVAAQATPVFSEQGLVYTEAFTRAAGLALFAKVNLSTWEEMGIGWHTAAAVADPDTMEHALQAHATDGQLDTEAPIFPVAASIPIITLLLITPNPLAPVASEAAS